MHQMEAEQLFQRASQQFQSNNYQNGLQILNQSIRIMPNKSSLYSNRALFYSQLGNIDAAVQDLNNALKYNPLNYVAYFNLFSIHYNRTNLQEAFDNLCCSLSCLYLIRAKKQKRQLDIQKSIKYAENNMQAHILKGLMYLSDYKYKLALNEIQWALDIQPNNAICMKIRNLINKKIDPYSVSDIIDTVYQENTFRLHTAYQPTDAYDLQIQSKVHEFNLIYDEIINSQYGTVTQKVPRMKVIGQNSNIINLTSKDIDQLSGIYEVKYGEKNIRPSRNNDQQQLLKDINQQIQLQQSKNQDGKGLILQEHDRQIVQNMIQNTKVNKSNNKDINKFIEEQLLLQNCYEEEVNLLQQTPHYEVDQRMLQNVKLIQEKIKIIQEQIKKQQVKKQKEIQGTPPSRSHSTSRKNSSKNKNSNKAKSPQKKVKIDVAIHQSKMSSASSSSANLYPISEKKKIQFTVISAEMKNPMDLKDLYLIGNYNARKSQRIKTPNKKIEGDTVRWFTVMSPTLISQTIQTLTVKVYSKQYFNYNDEQLGQGQVQVIKSGQLKIPIYFKNKISGYVNMKVDLL